MRQGISSRTWVFLAALPCKVDMEKYIWWTHLLTLLERERTNKLAYMASYSDNMSWVFLFIPCTLFLFSFLEVKFPLHSGIRTSYGNMLHSRLIKP